jgi:hypothetical protein
VLRTLKKFHTWMGRDNSVAFHAASLFALPVTALPYVVLGAIAAGETLGDIAKLAGKGIGKTASGGKAIVDKAIEQRRRRLAEEADKKRQEEEEAKKPKPLTKTQVRQALRELYFDLLEEIDLDPLMNEDEKEAAREVAKAKYLKRLDEVM